MAKEKMVYAFLQQPAGKWNGVQARVIGKFPISKVEAAKKTNPKVYYSSDLQTAKEQLEQYQATIPKSKYPLPSAQVGIYKQQQQIEVNGIPEPEPVVEQPTL